MFKENTINLGAGKLMSGVYFDGGITVIMRVNDAPVKKRITSGVRTQGVISYSELCAVLPTGIIEDGGGIRYEKSDSRRA